MGGGFLLRVASMTVECPAGRQINRVMIVAELAGDEQPYQLRGKSS